MNAWVADALFLLTATIYLVAGLMFLAVLLGRGEKLTVVAPRLLLAGTLLHAGHIVVASFVWKVCPVEGIHFPMSVLSMLVCATYLVMRSRWRIDVAGAFVAPLALSTLLASRFVNHGGLTPSARVKSAILPLHVTMNIVGVALFTLAFAAAALYLVQERLLKRKRVGGMFQRLPPLDALDRAEHRFLLAGFPLFTLGILTGTLWAHRVTALDVGDILRAVFGYVTWLLFAGVLFLRAAAGWRGRRAAYGTIAGFGCAMFVLVLYLLRPQSATVAMAMLGGPTP
jgi:ABC-type uncharacterized transport system permease subunit